MKQIVSLVGLLVLSLSFSVQATPPSNVPPQQIWSPTAAEKAAIDRITAMILKKIDDGFHATGKAVRDAHAKQHGCVKASFTILPKLAEKNLNLGIFANEGHTYKTWIRFSNGSGDPKGDDLVPAGRGMAIKVFGVEGAKFLDDEKFTQDFQMINFPAFFVKNAIDYEDFQKDPGTFFGTPQKPNPKHIEEFKVVGALSSPVVNPPMSPLESTYFSMTARQLGPIQKLNPIKFSAKPVPCVDGAALPTPMPLRKSTDALRIAMRDTLKTRDACFVFRIQKQTNDTDMPVNNPVKVWSEKESEFVPVAKIVIKAQAFDGDKGARQETFCEDLTISPWHSTEDHQPLGSIELTRKVVYDATSELRHRRNERPRAEPTGDEEFQKKP